MITLEEAKEKILNKYPNDYISSILENDNSYAFYLIPNGFTEDDIFDRGYYDLIDKSTCHISSIGVIEMLDLGSTFKKIY